MVKSKNYRLGMYEKSMPPNLTWHEKLMTCKECGFDWLEMSVDESDDKLSRLDWDDEQINQLCMEIKKTGVPIHTMCLSGHRKYPLGDPDVKIQNQSLEIMEKAILLSSKLGVRFIQLAGYDVYYKKGDEQTKKTFISNLRKATEMAACYGVVLGFETMETPFMDTVEKAMEYVRLINSPYLQIYPDIGNLSNSAKLYHHTVVSDLMFGKGHIIAAHLKETKPGIYRNMNFGEGHTDYIEDIQCLKDQGVCMFTGEFWYTGQSNWKDICKKSSDFLRTKLTVVYNANEQ